MEVFFCGLAALLGAVLGSFLNCAAWRTARGQAWWTGRSRCPVCGHALGALELIPVLSFLLQRGRCRHCGAKLPWRYLLTELGFGLLTVLSYRRFGLSLYGLGCYVFFCCLLRLSLVDWEIYIIPDGCLIAAALAWPLTLPALDFDGLRILERILSALVFGGGMLLLARWMDRLLDKESLGGGDIKLFALLGLYLGFARSLLALLLSSLLGLLLALVPRGGDKRIPFAPAISLAAALTLLWGDTVIDWYLGLFAF